MFFPSPLDALRAIGIAVPSEFSGREPGEVGLGELAEEIVAAQVASVPFAALWETLGRHPVVGVNAAGEALVITKRLGTHVRVQTPRGRRWLSRKDVLARLGISAGEECPWLMLAPPAKSLLLPAGDDPWATVAALLRGERDAIMTIGVYAAGVGLLSLAVPLTVQALVNTVAFGQLMQPVFVLGALLTLGLVAAGVLRGLQAWVVEVVQRRIFVRLVSTVTRALPRVRGESFQRGEGATFLHRFFDVFTVQKAFASLLLGGVEALLAAVVGLLVLAFYHPLLLAFGAFIVAAMAAVFGVLGRGGALSSIKESKAKYAVSGWLEESARHLMVLKHPAAAAFMEDRMDTLVSQWLGARASHFRVFFRQRMASLGLQALAHAAILMVGGWLVVERQLTIGQLVAAELIVAAIVASISKLGAKLETVYDLVAATEKLAALLALPEEAHPDHPVPLSEEGPVVLQFDAVRGHESSPHPLSAAARAGDGVAILGESEGAFDSLRYGIESLAEGSIRIDGHDLRDVEPSELRERVHVIMDAEVLPGSIADNLRLGDENLETTELWGLLRRVGLADRVAALPRGLATQLAPSGHPLHIRERLRLRLARALATAAGAIVLGPVFDVFPEATLRHLLAEAHEGRTLVLGTARPGVARLCDRIVRLPGFETDTEDGDSLPGGAR